VTIFHLPLLSEDFQQQALYSLTALPTEKDSALEPEMGAPIYNQ
jgi:hypothetical protein